MYPKENLKYKTIFDKYLIDDLLPYTLSLSSKNVLNIEYDVTGTSQKATGPHPITFKTNLMDSIRFDTFNRRTVVFPGNQTTDVWMPAYVYNDNYIDNKILGKNYSIKRPRFGIEKFISFVPQFKNWSVSNNDVVLGMDWIINAPFVPYDIDHALLFWYRRNAQRAFNWDQISTGSIIKNLLPIEYIDKNGYTQTIPAKTRIAKHSDTILVRLDLDNDDRIIKYDKIKFDTVAGLPIPLVFLYADDTADTDISPFSYWIPDGDYFAYSSKKSDLTQYAEPLDSYISPNLFSVYRNIYDLITKKTPRSSFSENGRGERKRDLRQIKRLAKLLSTFPLIDRTTQSYLLDSELQDMLQAPWIYPISTVVDKFSLLVKDLSLNRLPNNLSNNIISSKEDLFKKILNKYSGHLLISQNQNTILEYTGSQDLSKSNIFINQSITNLAPIVRAGIVSSSPTHLYNNQEINIGYVNIKTFINETESRISMNGKDLPLFDVGKTYDQQDISFYVQDTVVAIPDASVSTEKKIELKSNFSSNQNSSFSFSQLTGPCLRFNDYDRDRFRVSRFTSSSYKEPDMYIYGCGKYKIKGMVSLDSDTMSDVATVYAINTGPDARTPNGYYFTNTYNLSTLDIIGAYGTSLAFDYPIYSYTDAAIVIREFSQKDKKDFVTPITSPIAPATISIPSKNGQLDFTNIKILDGGLGFLDKPYIQKGDVPFLLPTNKDGEEIDINKLIYIQVRSQEAPASDLLLSSIRSQPVAYSEANNENLTFSAGHTPTILRSDNLKITCPTISQLAIHQSGIFWPIKTNSYVGERSPQRVIVNIDNQGLNTYRLGPLDRFFFDVTPKPKRSPLKISFYPNNTLVSIDRIILENMRSSDHRSASCKSFFEDLTFRETRTFKDANEVPVRQNKYARRMRYPYSRYFNSYSTEGIPILNNTEFVYPNVSTKNAPALISYGNYEPSLVSNLGINIPDHGNYLTALPTISGHYFADETELGEDGKPYRLCYLKPTTPSNATVFKKGVFHPASGWIKDDHSNRSSVLKFNPGDRKTFRLLGIGFSNMVSKYSDFTEANSSTKSDFNIPSVYKSSINLSISDQVASTPKFEDEPDEQIEMNLQKDKKKEIGDIDPNLGYRNLGYKIDGKINGIPSDEFGVIDNLSNTTDPHCNQNITYSYQFPVKGSKIYRTDSIDKDGEFLGAQNKNIENLTIQDIEIKLQFLNYVNTKNLIVWLEVTPSAGFVEMMSNKKSTKNILNHDDEFCASQSTNKLVKPYLDRLKDMNSNSSSKIKLVLLNREHIENNRYNACIHFSDHASKHNELLNQNFYSNHFYMKENYDSKTRKSTWQPNSTKPIDKDVNTTNQQVVNRDTLYVQPTLVADAYNDRDVAVYKTILKTNDIIDSNNTFAKFKDMPLFRNSPLKLNNFDSNTTFTLNIAVVDDSDEMFDYDNIMNTKVLAGFSTVEEKLKSTQLYNSLCYWELILHTSPTPKFVPSDSLGQINYDENTFKTGYNFIADFKDKKHLIPPVNLNAPNVVLNNSNLCTSYNDGAEQSTIVNKVDLGFVSYQVLGIVAAFTLGAGLAAAGGGAAGAMVGASVGAAFASPFYFALNIFLSQMSIQQTQTTFDEHVEKGNYDQWGYGQPDKALLEVSKDNLIWYSLEAPIFKYSNSLILKPNQYKYIKLKNSQAKSLSQFNFNLISAYTDLIDNVSASRNSFSSATGSFVDSISVVPISKIEDIPLYSLMKNNVLGLKDLNSAFCYTLKIEGQRAYNFFNKGDEVIINDNDKSKFSVLAKGWVDKDDKIYSIIQILLISGEELKGSGKIGLKDDKANVVMIFKDGNSPIENVPINKWSLEKSAIKPESPSQSVSFLGEGSYGYGSSILKQDYLSDIHYDNSIKPIYEILNSNKNNRYKYNRINIGNNFSSNSKTQGYAYGLDTILNTTNYQTTDPQLILPTNFADETIKTKILALLSVDSKPNTNTTNYSFMDIKSDGLIAAPDYGTLSIENDNIIIEPNYCLTTEQIDILVARLSTLNGPAIPLVEVGLAGSAPSNSIINSIDSILTLEQYHDSLPVDPLGICYSKSTYSSKSCPKNETKQRLYRLYDERNEITNLLATRAQETIINGISSYVTLCDNTILPYQSINIVTNEDRSLSFTITSNKDYYWIHIDPHQQCQLSQTATIKILAETKYYCLPTRTITSQGGLQYQVGDPESFNVCLPNPPTKTFTDPDREIESIELGSGSDRGNAAIYKIPPHIIDAQKAKYPQITEWEKVVLYGPTGPTRTFYINTDGGNNDIYVNVTETYWVPAKSYIEQGYQEPLTDVKNKVQDIFNLDNTTELHVRFKNIPRKMKAVDQHYDRYEPNANGGYSQGSLKDGRGGLVNNDLVFWSCFNINNGKHSPLTRFFKGMNEMIFRSFFGSTDGIENKSTEVADSKEPWEWIPYEYDI